MDVEADARRLGVGPQPRRPSGVADLGALVALRVAEEELHVGRPTCLRLGDRVGLLDVGSEGEVGWAHAAIVGKGADSASAARWWQAERMNAIVLVVLTLALLGIVVAAGWVVVAALSTHSRD